MAITRSVLGLVHEDDFDTDTRSDYTFTGSSTVTTAVGSGRLRLSPPDNHRIAASVDGITQGRCFAQMRLKYPSGVSASYSALLLRADTHSGGDFNDALRTNNDTFGDTINISKLEAGTGSAIDSVAESGWPVDTYFDVQFFIDDGVQQAYWSVGPQTLVGADTVYDGVEDHGIGFWAQRFDNLEPHIDFDHVAYWDNNIVTVSGLSTGQKAQIRDASLALVAEATESGGTAQIDVSRYGDIAGSQGANAVVPIGGFHAVMIVESDDSFVDLYDDTGVYPGDVYSYSASGGGGSTGPFDVTQFDLGGC